MIADLVNARLVRLGFAPLPVAAGAALPIELAGVPCELLLRPAGGAPLADRFRREGRLVLTAYQALEDEAMVLVIHAPRATAPRAAMRRLLDRCCTEEPDHA